jgi:hypothetical protein
MLDSVDAFLDQGCSCGHQPPRSRLLIWHFGDLYAAMHIGRMGFVVGLPLKLYILICLATRAMSPQKVLIEELLATLECNCETPNHVKRWCEAELSAAIVEL